MIKRILTLFVAVLCLSSVACYTCGAPAPEKPILYFYPEEDTIINAKVELNGHFTCTYPEHGADGWQNYLAKPDGTLFSQDGRAYYALYWEGEINASLDFTQGFCVEGSRTADFLAEVFYHQPIAITKILVKNSLIALNSLPDLYDWIQNL